MRSGSALVVFVAQFEGAVCLSVLSVDALAWMRTTSSTCSCLLEPRNFQERSFFVQIGTSNNRDGTLEMFLQGDDLLQIRGDRFDVCDF